MPCQWMDVLRPVSFRFIMYSDPQPVKDRGVFTEGEGNVPIGRKLVDYGDVDPVTPICFLVSFMFWSVF